MSDIREQTPSEASPSIFERRKDYRLSIKMPVVVGGFYPQTLESFRKEVLTQNVSRYGTCFELHREMARVGSILDLSMGKRFEAKCRVSWVKDIDKDNISVGVEFVSTVGQWVLYN
jgi:hypothetical protein